MRLPIAPAKCAVILLVVITKSHALIIESAPFIFSYKLMLSIDLIFIPKLSFKSFSSNSVSPYCKLMNSQLLDFKNLQ